MIYLLYSLEDYLIKKEINKIIKENNISEFNINNFSMVNDKLDIIIEDFETYSMFGDKKIVIINDSIVFSSKKNDLDIIKVENYLKDFNKETIHIFVLKEQKLDERKKIVKLIREKGKVLELSYNSNTNILVKEMFGDYQISDANIKLLIDLVGNNLGLLEQEINKIKIYKDKDFNIIEEDIKNLVSKNIEADIFTLVDQCINKDKKNAIATYHELIINNEEPISIIISLANKLRMIYQTKELFKKGYSEKDIAQILKVKPGYLFYMRKTLNNYESEKIVELLGRLADLDYKIKSGEIDRVVGFELFILSL